MKALDTNVLVRFLIDDDRGQGERAKKLFERAEASGTRFLITTVVVLELIWVLRAVYAFTRAELLEALELLTGMPIFEFERYDTTIRLISIGRSEVADLPDLLIGLAAKAQGCETTLTFEKRLAKSGLFERL